jgi:hypothetical protein
MNKADKLLIYWMGIGVLACGAIMMFSTTVGQITLNFLFLLYILVRVAYYRKIWKSPFKSIDKQRLVLLVVLSMCVLLNFLGLQESYFLLIFILMLEYLLVINRERQDKGVDEK